MTPALAAASLYTGLLGLLAFWIAIRVGKVRTEEKISIGDGGNQRMIRRMRGHANFVENTPLGLIILILSALVGAPVWLLHVLGALLFIGRLLHAVHFMADDAPGWQRMYGTILTALSIMLGSIGLIGHAAINLS